ncbi:MAG: hypothetical protein KDB90_15560 [Planctomycetes bacterium]|nr:hypothetical protein [Planctomycetota bacterium]
MPGSNEPTAKPQVPEERRFVWRNLEAFLSGELSSSDRARIEAFLCECPYTKEYVETERQFVDAVKRCMDDAPECPEGLRSRVMLALDRCEHEILSEDVSEDEEKRAFRLGFPWAGAVMFAAASVMLVIALVLVFSGPTESSTTGLPDGLAPMVAHVSLDAPVAEKCRYGDAMVAYRKYFSDGPELPHELDGAIMKVSKWECEVVNGRRIMCAVYDTLNGERFGVMVFKCNCLEKSAPEGVQAAEVMVDGKVVLMWREGQYFRALVGDDSASLRRHMEELRKNL